MSNKHYHVTLEPHERQALEELTRSGRREARRINRARVLLLADQSEGGPAWPDERIAQAVGGGVRTVERLRRRFIEAGPQATVAGKPSERVYPRKLDGAQEAHLIALACSEPPQGQARWSLRLLADQLVELGQVQSVSHETVRQVLKKTRSSPGARSSGASRPRETRAS